MTIFGETEHFRGENGTLRWSILVGTQKHNVQKPTQQSRRMLILFFQSEALSRFEESRFQTSHLLSAYLKFKMAATIGDTIFKI